MFKTPRLHLAAIGIVVTTLVSGCAVVEPPYYDDDPYSTPRRHSDPYYSTSPGYYDSRPGYREYYPPRNPPPRHDWRDHDERDHRDRARRPDHRDDHDARDRPPPRRQPAVQNNPQPHNPPPNQPLRVLPKVKLSEDDSREHPPRNKSDRYNPKTGQHLPKANDMP